LKDPLLHPRSQKQLNLYLKKPSHGLILHGPKGIGKTFVAKWLAGKLESDGTTVVEKLEKQSTISIDQIRTLYSQTKTGRKQTIVIQNAQELGTEAQNAFLKLLEEPPEGTTFILTLDRLEGVLPTIQSRAQAIELLRPSEAALVDYFNQSSDDFMQLSRSVGSLPAKVATSLSDEEYKQQILDNMQRAKMFYSSGSYSRHKILIEINYEKEKFEPLLRDLYTIIITLLKARSSDANSIKKLAYQTKLLDEVSNAVLDRPGNPKIQLTKLAEML